MSNLHICFFIVYLLYCCRLSLCEFVLGQTPNSKNQQAAEPVSSGGSMIEYAKDASELASPCYGL